jgi:hypothetical protein
MRGKDETHPLKIPELREIASFLGESRYLSSLSQVDQLTYVVVRPCLFHSIEVSLDFVHSLALVFQDFDSTVACRSLSSNSALGANHGSIWA